MSASRVSTSTKETSGISSTPSIFTLAAIVLVVFWIVWLSTYVVHRTYTSGDTSASVANHLESIWSWLLLVGIGWGLVNLHWSLASLQRANLKAFVGHWMLAAACGLIVVGIESVMIARAFTISPVVIDHSKTDDGSTAQAETPASATLTAGDPDKGKLVFSKTCITCHGPSGQGMPNLAPSLVGSKFIGSADDTAITNVIRLGRALGDPNNKSGKVMPARGGNPFLTDEDVAHLVAFVKAIQSATVAPADSTQPAVQLAAWVVPSAKPPRSGIKLDQANQEQVAGLQRIDWTAGHRGGLIRWLTVILTTAHALFVVGVVAISSCVVLPRMMSSSSSIESKFIQPSVVGWVIAAVAWLLIAWLCFWWR